MATGSYLSVITLNVNGLNAPTKRQRLAEWIQKQDPYICCLKETHLKTGDTYRLKVKGWKKIFHAHKATTKEMQQFFKDYDVSHELLSFEVIKQAPQSMLVVAEQKTVNHGKKAYRDHITTA